MTHKLLSSFALAALLFAATSAIAEETHTAPAAEMEANEEGGWAFGAGFSLDYCTKQLTYGLIDNDQPIVTPAVEISFGNDEFFTLSAGAEAIFDTTRWGAKDGGYNDRRYKYQELAFGLTLARTWDFASWMGSSLDTSVNYTYEYHPRACNKPDLGYSNPDTQWLNFEISAGDFWLVPTFTLEYQIDDQQGSQGAIYATLDVSHEFDLGALAGLDDGFITLTPTVGMGMGNSKRNRDFNSEDDDGNEVVCNDGFMFRDAYAKLELNIAPSEYFSITPYVGCNQQIDSKARESAGDDEFVCYAGISIGAQF